MDADIRPPARRGDIAAAATSRPPAIVLIDGVYERVPAVSHKEILWALQRGTPVYGAASMGALRAAELDRYGMVGVGQVYEWLRDERFTADDAVAVAHLDAEHGHRAVSTALVDIAATADDALTAGVIDAAMHAALLAAASRRYYAERRWPALWADLGAAAAAGVLDPEAVKSMRSWVGEHARSAKADDAFAVLSRVATDLDTGAATGGAAPITWRLADTVHWRRLRQRSGGFDEAPLPDEALHDQLRARTAYADGYLRSLATRLATELAAAYGVHFDSAHARSVLAAHVCDAGASIEAWATAHDLDPTGLDRVARSQAALDWAIGHFHDDTVAGIADVSRVHGTYRGDRDAALAQLARAHVGAP
ncbi:MAG: TfuA-like protein [Ilumatobacteraceae bacterium]